MPSRRLIKLATILTTAYRFQRASSSEKFRPEYLRSSKRFFPEVVRKQPNSILGYTGVRLIGEIRYRLQLDPYSVGCVIQPVSKLMLVVTDSLACVLRILG